MNRVLSLKLNVNRALDEILEDKTYGLGLLDDAIYDLKEFCKDVRSGKWSKEEENE